MRAGRELARWRVRLQATPDTICPMMIDTVSRKEKLTRRLRSLWAWELFDSLFFPALMIFYARVLHYSAGLFTIYSAGLVTWLLWQGSVYWWLKLRALRTGTEIETKHLRRFRVLKRVNWILIGTLPVVLAARGLTGVPFVSTFDLVAGLGLYALAVLEQINYYHYQLMYDYPPDWRYLVERKRLKRSSLRRAMEKAE